VAAVIPAAKFGLSSSLSNEKKRELDFYLISRFGFEPMKPFNQANEYLPA
jgi:hypothetical protein